VLGRALSLDGHALKLSRRRIQKGGHGFWALLRAIKHPGSTEEAVGAADRAVAG